MPAGRIIPTIRYKDCPAAIDWLQRAFCFESDFTATASQSKRVSSCILNCSPSLKLTQKSHKRKVALPVSVPMFLVFYRYSNGSAIFSEDFAAFMSLIAAVGSQVQALVTMVVLISAGVEIM